MAFIRSSEALLRSENVEGGSVGQLNMLLGKLRNALPPCDPVMKVGVIQQVSCQDLS